MRGVHSIIDDARRNVFTEVARLAYTGDYDSVDSIPYRIIPGEIARHRNDVFLERAVVAARVMAARSSMGLYRSTSARISCSGDATRPSMILPRYQSSSEPGVSETARRLFFS